MRTKDKVLMILCQKCKKSFSLDVSYDDWDIECPHCEKKKLDDFNMRGEVVERVENVKIVKKQLKKS